MGRDFLMSFFSRQRIALAAAACVGVMASPAIALTCSVSAQSVAFGNYDPLASSTVHGVGNIHVSCDGAASYSIALSQGAGSFATRVMTNGPAQIQYNLYTSPLRTTVWGDGSGGTATVTGSGTGGDHSVYGSIPGGQNLPAGTYSDQLIVTLTY